MRNKFKKLFLNFLQKIFFTKDNQFLTTYQIPVMYDDGFQTSYPVSAEVNTPAEINSAFGSITYSKGASILRMLESTVGESNFREGLNVNMPIFKLI
jgi:aminopeptidase N